MRLARYFWSFNPNQPRRNQRFTKKKKIQRDLELSIKTKITRKVYEKPKGRRKKTKLLVADWSVNGGGGQPPVRNQNRFFVFIKNIRLSPFWIF